MRESRPTVTTAPRKPSMPALLRAFGWIGLTSLGQGRTAYFYEELVRKRRWVTETEFLEGVGIGHLLPGPNVTNLSVYFGQRLGGARGALLATAAQIIPGAVLLLGLSILYFRGLPAALTDAVGRGVGAAAVGLVVATTWRSGAAVLRTGRGAAITLLTFALFGPAQVNVFLVLAFVAPLSIALAWLRRPRAERGP